jgi:hypothetical protein
MESVYKSEDVIAAPIRVIQLLYNSGVSLKNVGRNIFHEGYVIYPNLYFCMPCY